ncbi:MAG: transposase [candidate division WOR-3 bacterium]|nr:transposase [candidate division WOR-3 bacterium]
MGEKKRRRSYTDAFKREVVRQMETTNKSVSEIVEENDINPDMIYHWRLKILRNGEDRFPGKGKLSKKDKERAMTKKKIKDLEEENEILKKAISIFTQDRNGSTRSWKSTALSIR